MSVDMNKYRRNLTLVAKKAYKNRIIKEIQRCGILRPIDLDKLGIPRVYLSRLCNEGTIKRLERGLYTLATTEMSAAYQYAEAAKRIPIGIICLISALQYHQLTTQIASEVWVAIDPKARLPKDTSLRLKIVRFSGKALTEGIEIKRIDKVLVRMYCPAKTAADCFKYRNKIGLEVALEALRDCWKKRLVTMDELWRYAKICRVRPYLESLV
jgi:predicted transcriptional regulator of viral defense system